MALDNSLLNKITNNDISITELDFSSNVLTDNEMGSLATAIKTNNHITSVDFTNNNLNCPNGIKLLKALNGKKSLQKLSLRNCNIVDNSDLCAEATSVISSCSNLESIDIQHNRINHSGNVLHQAAISFVNALSSNTSIIRFECSAGNSSFYLTENHFPSTRDLAMQFGYGGNTTAVRVTQEHSRNMMVVAESKKLQNTISSVLARNIASKAARAYEKPPTSNSEQAAIIKAQGDLLNKQSEVIANLQTQMQQMMQTQQLILQTIQLNTSNNNNNPEQASSSARLFKG